MHVEGPGLWVVRGGCAGIWGLVGSREGWMGAGAGVGHMAAAGRKVQVSFVETASADTGFVGRALLWVTLGVWPPAPPHCPWTTSVPVFHLFIWKLGETGLDSVVEMRSSRGRVGRPSARGGGVCDGEGFPRSPDPPGRGGQVSWHLVLIGQWHELLASPGAPGAWGRGRGDGAGSRGPPPRRGLM